MAFSNLTEETIKTVRKQLPQRLPFLSPLDRIREYLTIPMLGKAIPLTERTLRAEKRSRRHEAKRTHAAMESLFRRRDGIAEVMLAALQAKSIYKSLDGYPPPPTFRRSYSYDSWLERHTY